MIRRLALLFVVLSLGISVQAQKNKSRCSQEEFRERQKSYLTEKAELSSEEAAKFFPLYFELQDKKKAINDESWKRSRKGKDPQTTEAEYEEIIDLVVKTRIKADELDMEYLQKFKKVLSARKIYKLQRAEMKFHRDLLKIMHQPDKNQGKK